MIARIWEGRTDARHYEAYTEFMKTRAVPDYQTTDGFIKLSFLRQLDGDTAHFKLITYWEGIEVIKNFAGEDFEKAKHYPEDKTYLLDFPEKVKHYDVFSEQD